MTSAVATNLEGRFEISVPHEAERIQLTVAPPVGALRAIDFDVLRSLDEDLVVRAESASGVLTLDPTLFGEVIVFQDGFPIGEGTLRQWATMNGVLPRDDSVLQIQKMAVGNYTVCRMSNEERMAMLLTGGRPSADHSGCATGFLSPGGSFIPNPSEG